MGDLDASDPFRDPFTSTLNEKPISDQELHELINVDTADPFAELREDITPSPSMNNLDEFKNDYELVEESESVSSEETARLNRLEKMFRGLDPSVAVDYPKSEQIIRDLDANHFDDGDKSSDYSELDEANRSVELFRERETSAEAEEEDEEEMISVSLSTDEPRINIAITGTQIAWEDSKMDRPVTLFKVEASMTFGGIVIKKRTCLHRYSSFHKMNSDMRSEYARTRSHLLPNLPSLPPKRFLVDHTSENFILQRKFLLAQYLRKLAYIPHIQKCAALLIFLKLDC